MAEHERRMNEIRKAERERATRGRPEGAEHRNRVAPQTNTRQPQQHIEKDKTIRSGSSRRKRTGGGGPVVASPAK